MYNCKRVVDRGSAPTYVLQVLLSHLCSPCLRGQLPSARRLFPHGKGMALGSSDHDGPGQCRPSVHLYVDTTQAPGTTWMYWARVV